MKKPKHPCKPDCERRAVGCSATCKEWQEYEPARNAWYAERAKEQLQISAVIENAERCRKIRAKRKGKKLGG